MSNDFTEEEREMLESNLPPMEAMETDNIPPPVCICLSVVNSVIKVQTNSIMQPPRGSAPTNEEEARLEEKGM